MCVIVISYIYMCRVKFDERRRRQELYSYTGMSMIWETLMELG